MYRHRSRFVFSSLIIWVAIIHLTLAVVVLKSDFIDRVKGKMGWGGSVNPHISNMHKYHAWMDAQVPQGAVLFLGDSITQGLVTSSVIPCSVNFGIGAQTTIDLIEFMPNYHSINHASAVVIQIGINDFANGLQEGIEGRFSTIISQIPPSIPIVLTSVMPVNRKNISMQSIASANKSLHKICQQREGCYFLDTWEVLLDDNGILQDIFYTDGVHLSSEGYRAWKSALHGAISSINKWHAGNFYKKYNECLDN